MNKYDKKRRLVDTRSYPFRPVGIVASDSASIMESVVKNSYKSNFDENGGAGINIVPDATLTLVNTTIVGNISELSNGRWESVLNDGNSFSLINNIRWGGGIVHRPSKIMFGKMALIQIFRNKVKGKEISAFPHNLYCIF